MADREGVGDGCHGQISASRQWSLAARTKWHVHKILGWESLLDGGSFGWREGVILRTGCSIFTWILSLLLMCRDGEC